MLWLIKLSHDYVRVNAFQYLQYAQYNENYQKYSLKHTLYTFAERQGFEPSVGVNLHTLSKRAPSATRTPLQKAP